MNRDPERLKRINDKVILLWELVPDWRYGQLVENALKAAKGKAYHAQSLFYYEDEDFEEGLGILQERYSKSRTVDNG